VFHCGDGIQDSIGTMLVIDCEGCVAVLHLVSGFVIPQQRVPERYCLGRKPDGRMREQRGKLNISKVGVRSNSQGLARQQQERAMAFGETERPFSPQCQRPALPVKKRIIVAV
jgi:hypothetical protein